MPKKHAIRNHIGKFYEVTDTILGQGSFSTVYLAHHKLLGNKVAVKVINRDTIEEEYVSKNLTREASILKILKHPNIVNFYEEFSHNQLYCLSMELVNGCDLSNFLKKQNSRKVSEKFAKILFSQMVSAVNYMHKAHILHRDLKQENILLEYDRVIKIVDFGLSNAYYPYTHLRTHCGSLEYAAPELFEHTSIYGAGVDVWSLGVILYAMVTGRMPFTVHKEEKDNPNSTNYKDRFCARISQGLIEENWKHLGHLSFDCCSLLVNLLQPNHCKRLRIRQAYTHPWLQKDDDMRKSLPQYRPDLKRRYKSEVIDWIAEKMRVPTRKLEIHLASIKFDSMSAIYHMVQDTLVKEVLYPPEDLKNSFIFRLHHRRKRNSYCDSFEPKQEDLPKQSEHRESLESQGFVMKEPSYRLDSSRMQQRNGDGFVFRPREIWSRNQVVIPKLIGDGEHFDRPPKERLTILKSNHAFAKREGDHVLRKDASKATQRVGDPLLMTQKPFRSYKNNRPVRDKLLSDDFVTEVPEGKNRVCVETQIEKDSSQINGDLDHTLKSSIDSNYRRNVMLLREKYGLKYQISSKAQKYTDRQEMQNKREWKIACANVKYEQTDTSTDDNRPIDCGASKNTNALRETVIDNDVMKICRPEKDYKEDYNPSHKSTARPKTGDHSKQFDQTTKTFDKMSAGKDCSTQFTTLRNQQHKQRSLNCHITNHSTDGNYPGNKVPGICLRHDPLPSFEKVQPSNGFSKKIICSPTFTSKKPGSQIQVDVLQKPSPKERVER